MSKFSYKQRQKVAVRPIPQEKKPYMVRGLERTILHLTSDQAAKRFDLIPQFQLVLPGAETVQGLY